MDYNIKFIVSRILYEDTTKNFRIISCKCASFKRPDGFTVDPKYYNFTIKGSNLWNYYEGKQYEATLRRDMSDTKYPNSYLIVGIPGLSMDKSGIHIDERSEMAILKRFMTDKQAINVHMAYPNFVQMVVDGKESEIDFDRIYNVKAVRFESYIRKIKSDCAILLFYPTCEKYGIREASDIERIISHYSDVSLFVHDLENNPYNTLIEQIEFSFKKADYIIRNNFKNHAESETRCLYVCDYLLNEFMEATSSTRMSASQLFRQVEAEYNECLNHVFNVLTTNDKFHYDPESKTVTFESIYEAELYIRDEIVRRIQNPNPIDMNAENYRHVDGFDMTDEQFGLLKLAENYDIAILTGPPGAGKSSSLKALINMLEDNHQSYKMVAPTGIAAKRMIESTGRKATTIHKALISDNIKGYNYLIIDEFSMVGIPLFSHLLESIDNNTKIILVCDADQLASIAIGNLIQDMLDSGIVPTARLTKVFRYGKNGISTIVADVKNGNVDAINQKWNEVEYIPLDSDPIHKITKLYFDLKNQGYTSKDIMILSPNKIREYGTYRINNLLQTEFNPHEYSASEYKIGGNLVRFKLGDKVINTKNNYMAMQVEYDPKYGDYEHIADTTVVNGDIGYIVDFVQQEDGQHIIVEFDDVDIGTTKLIEYCATEINLLQLAYAMTVHKVQGNEARVVIFLAHPSQVKMLTRNLVYVALSRAKERLYIISDESVLNECIQVQENKIRDTWLGKLLKEVNL